MIFVTVGTHEQQFNRLVKTVDELKGNGQIKEEVFIQIGYCDYIPWHCQWSKIIPYTEMIHKMKEARIVITHGGPASFMQVLQLGKSPVVVPRQMKYGEHINNHQVEFCQHIDKKSSNIITVYDITKLEESIKTNNKINVNSVNLSNNNKFIENLKKILLI